MKYMRLRRGRLHRMSRLTDRAGFLKYFSHSAQWCVTFREKEDEK
jgi:hypothetical protein